MERYTHLTEGERYQIFILHKAGMGIREMARELNRHRTTIYRELHRNRVDRIYAPSRAQGLMRYRRRVKPTRRIQAEVWRWVVKLIERDWSPQQVAGWGSRLKHFAISHETIYRRIWADRRAGGSLYRHLRLKLRRCRRYCVRRSRGLIVGRVGIEHRPRIVERKARIGDWELDTLFGRRMRGGLITASERKSRLTVIARIESKRAVHVAARLIETLKGLPRRIHTLTSDNGKEFAGHRTIASALQAKFYFARPYASWERGLNENTNGLIRQYLPRSRDFSTITDEEIAHVMNRLNHRPRRILNYRTPYELFFRQKTVALQS
jgi:transposase, IS30 family